MKLLPHKFAELMPPTSKADYAALKADIEANGQQDEVVLFQGKILDGRNRYDVMTELKIRPRFTTFKGTEAEAIAFVKSRHTRRDMSVSQKIWAACNFFPSFKAEAAARKSRNGGAKSGGGKLSCPVAGSGGTTSTPPALAGEKANGTARDCAGAAFGVSGVSVAEGLKIKAADSDAFAKMGTGEWTLSQAKHAVRTAARRKALPAIKSLPLNEEFCKLLSGDAIKRLEELKSQSVKVVCTDPPYNIGKHYHGAKKNGDSLEDVRFIEWCSSWIAECVRVLTPDGSIFIMMNGKYSPALSMAMRAAGLHWRNTIYWWENNPENQQGNFSDAVRQIHYFTRSETGSMFNTDVRIPSRRNEIGDKRGIDTGKLPDNVWIEGRIPGNSGERVPWSDPPQLPVSIPETCIRVASEPGDTILDPFHGNGTTAIAALRNGRKYIGFEQSSKYLDRSRRWIAAQLAG